MIPEKLPNFSSVEDLVVYGVVAGIVLLVVVAVRNALSDMQKGEGPSQAAVLKDALEALTIQVIELRKAQQDTVKEGEKQNRFFAQNVELMKDFDRVLGAIAPAITSAAHDTRQITAAVDSIRDSVHRMEGKK